jgi:hypothetical protein
VLGGTLFIKIQENAIRELHAITESAFQEATDCANIQKYKNNQKLHFNIYDVLYSYNSHQQVLAGIPAIFRLMLLQEYTCG